MSPAPDADGGPLLLVGGGKMGGALLQGWLERGWGPRLTVVDPRPSDALVALASHHGIAVVPGPAGLAPPAAIVLAVKPQMLAEVAPALAPLCGPGTLLVSVLAGKTTGDLAARLPAGAVVRAMPNTPAAIGKGITGVWATATTSPAQRALTEALLGAVGPVEWLDREADIDIVTAISGSGPAYVFLMVEALAEAGRSLGLAEDQAMRLARATVVGAGALLDAEPATAAAQLRQNVTSPGGTTAAALAQLMAEDGLGPLLRRAALAARDRAEALAG